MLDRVRQLTIVASTLFVAFTVAAAGASAGSSPVLRFSDLPHGWVPSIPGDVQAVSRIVGTLDGHRIAAAPTRNGNYCEAFSAGRNGGTGGCRVRLPSTRVPQRPAQHGGYLIGAGGRAARTAGVPGLAISAIEGSTLAAPGARLYLVYADGMREELRILWVSKPIGAGFYFHSIPQAHRLPRHRPIALVLRRSGRVIARQALTTPQLPG
jgi:hypothetical protein